MNISKYLNIKIGIHKAKLATKFMLIPVEKILRGAEGDDLLGIKYVKMTGDIHRTSTRVIDGPQVELIADYLKQGNSIFEKTFFENTYYYKNAIQSIHYLGDYFPEAKDPSNIMKVAKRFIDSFLEKDISHYEQTGHDNYYDRIVVRPIINSDCYQIVSGNHRVASAFIKGQKFIEAIVRMEERTHTFFSELISDVTWDDGKEIYQPIDLPEFSSYTLVRKCSDRFDKIKSFLNNYKIKTNNKEVLDIGSNYGWFVNQLNKNGILGYGLEKDFTACQISKFLYSFNCNQIINITLEDFILNENKSYDIVFFLSILHHFILGKSYLTPQFVFSELSKRTKYIMFFEMGEDHEQMFQGQLCGWNENSIKKFIKQNSDFSKIITLGRDEDSIGKYQGDYHRMLFALIK